MGQSTEELNAQIAGTRESLGNDLDALQDRVSPSAIVDRRKAAVRGRARTMQDKVMGSVHRTQEATPGPHDAQHAVQSSVGAAQDRFEGAPLAMGLMAFGAGMVLSAILPASDAEQRAASQVADAVKEKAQPMMEEAKEAAQHIGQDLKESAAGAAQEVKESAADSASTVQDEGRSSAQSVRSQAQQ